MYYGLVGDIVNAIAPETEADPVALLAQFLVAFGNAAGRHTYFVADGAYHYPNLFAVLVADTSKGRKGTAWNHVRRVFEADQVGALEWAQEHILKGLSSGEGIIHHVRDEGGPTDKRVLATETEFASVLRMGARDGNNLSMVLRDAWDGEPLRTLTKNTPERATNAHVSLIGHITSEELLRALTAEDAANGLGNRFLWLCTKRAQVLPESGDLSKITRALGPLYPRLRAALDFAQQPRGLRRDDAARALWAQEYERLSDGQPGVVGKLTARAEAQVVRLALVHALLDRSESVGAAHLRAALALWEYAETSVRFIFGDALGDPIADTILGALRNAPEGLARTDLYALFSNNLKAHKLALALASLVKHHLARCETITTPGRSSERWHAVRIVTRKERNEESSHPDLSSSNSYFVPSYPTACTKCGGDVVRWFGDELHCDQCDELLATREAKVPA
jgi:hypothetical protein